jgi:TRAP-type C4-dicarboxylate transport system permease small subunit
MFGAVTVALNAIGTVLIIIMALAVNADVFGRNLLGQPIAGVNEFVGLAIVAVVFLQMANTLREDRHIANDLMISFVARTHPRIARLFYGLCHLAGALLLLLIVWYVLPILQSNYAGNFYLGTPGLAEVRVWPFMLAVLLGAMATAVQYGILAWRELRRALGAELA